MKKVFFIASLLCICSIAQAQLKESITWTKLNSHNVNLPLIGQLKTTPSDGTGNSYWSIGCETLDRDYSNFANYKMYLKDLGVGYARLQSGWAKTEKVKGQYDFAWLDSIVDGLLEQGIKPWLCLCYGNPLYSADIDLNAKIFTDKPTLEAWEKYVTATVKRYKGKVTMYEVWNEPDGHKGKINPGEAAGNLLAVTAKTICKVDKEVPIAAFGICSGANTPYITKAFDVAKKENALQYVNYITYHAYYPNPDDIIGSINKLRNALKKYEPLKIGILQGESGCPSQLEYGHALKNRDWSEYQQVKWDLRHMVNNFKMGIPSNVFTFVDLNYGWMLQSFGMIRMNLKNEPIYKRPSYHGVQHMATVLTTDIKPDTSLVIETACCKTISNVGLKKNGKMIGYMLWFSDEVPTMDLDKTCVSLRIKGVNIHDLAYVDMVTGKVYDMSSVVTTAMPDNSMKLTNIPLWDAPILIVQKSEIPIKD